MNLSDEQKEREEFEARFIKPDALTWNGSFYDCLEGWENSYRIERFLAQWQAWQARAARSVPPAAEGWKTGPAPKEAGRYIHVQQQATFRWLPYREGSEQLRKGIKGRWQEFKDYGWENAELIGTAWKDALIEPPAPTQGAR